MASYLSKPRAARRAIATPLAFAAALLAANQAHASLTLLQPPRTLHGDAPLIITVLVDNDESKSETYTLPASIEASVSNADNRPVALTLSRDAQAPGRLTLSPGQFRKVRYSAVLPARMRGSASVSLLKWDAATFIVLLDRAAPSVPVASAAPLPASASVTGTPAARSAEVAENAPPASTPHDFVTADSSIARLQSRLSVNEPIYFAVGKNGDTNAKFQFSFKFRLLAPEAPNSKAFLDNLYFGYTQLAMWNLEAPSKPFRDSNYRPSLFYYIPDTGWHSRWFTQLGAAAGLEHESNGRGGADSRSLNIAFVKPIFTFGNPSDYHWTVEPKLYAYLEKGENPDIAHYRGYMDLLLIYGKPNGWQLATTLRKGTRGGYGSIDAQLTYPLGKLLSGAGGYLWVGYFNGWGEDLLDYNQRRHSQFRIGYSVARW